jgi:cytoskeletal protein RodZ
MGTVASELKAEREKRNIPLAHIADETRISLRHLESLEEGRYNDMPGGIYNRAFLKAYCEILNLNVPEMMQHYENELSLVPEKSSRTRAHVPERGPSFNIGPIFIWGLMLAISASGLYFSRKWITAIFSPYFSHTPASQVRNEKTQSTPPSKHSEASAPAADPSAPATSSQSTVAALPQPSSATPASLQNSSPAATVASAVPTVPQTLQLEVAAAEKCWVSIERDGISALRKNMEPGEIQFFDAIEKFLVIAGNAGGVHLKINGKPAKPLGKPGSVVRILIDRNNLQDFLDQTAG